MPPGGAKQATRVRLSAPNERPEGVTTRSSKRQQTIAATHQEQEERHAVLEGDADDGVDRPLSPYNDFSRTCAEGDDLQEFEDVQGKCHFNLYVV